MALPGDTEKNCFPRLGRFSQKPVTNTKFINTTIEIVMNSL